MDFKRFLGNLAKTVLATGALSVSAFAGADTHNNPGMPCPAPAACVDNGCCCGEPCIGAPACGWAYNPPAYCRCNNPPDCCNACDGFGVRLDFLWWRSCVTGIALGVENEVATSDIDATHIRRLNTTHVKKPDFKFDPGFRLGLIDYCSCDCWDIALNWTHYHTHAKANGYSDISEDASPTVVFVSYWERGQDLIVDAAESRYSLTMDLLDLEFGRKYYVSSCFVLRPHFGLRGARFDQSYRAESYANRTPATVSGEVFDTYVKAKNDFLALGPRVGLDLEVHLGCGFALFGNAAGSLVYGKFDRHSKEFYIDRSQQTAPDFVSEFLYEAKSNADRCSRAFTDLAVGFKWSRCFDWCGRLHPISLAFAWEHHAFFNMNNFNFQSHGYDFQNLDATDSTAYSTGGKKDGDIYTQGLTVTANIGF